MANDENILMTKISRSTVVTCTRYDLSIEIPVVDPECVEEWSVHGVISSVGMVVRLARNSNTGQ